MKNIRLVTLSFLLSSILYSQDFRQTVAVIDFDPSGISQLEATSVSGTGSLAIITFSTKAAGKTTLIYSTDSILLDPDSNPIEIKSFGEGVIDAN